MTAPRMAYLLYYSCVIRVSFACHSCGVHRIRHRVTAIAPVVLFDYAHPVPVALLGNISKHHASAPASNRERPGEAGAAPRAGYERNPSREGTISAGCHGLLLVVALHWFAGINTSRYGWSRLLTGAQGWSPSGSHHVTTIRAQA